MNIGFIGLGRMGQPMARNILAGGHSLFVHDIRKEACTSLVADGAKPLDAPEKIAAHADIVFTSLPGPREVKEVMAGATGVIQGIKRKAIVIDTSTVGPTLSQRLATQFHEKGVAYLDAPVSGGRERAVSGTLTAMVGGQKEAFETARPILARIAPDLHYIGPSGSGNAIKLIIQMIYLPYVAAFCEGLALGEKIGIPFDTLFDILCKSSAGQPGFQKRYDMLKANDLTPRFEVNLAVKDLTLASELCAEYQQPALIAEAANKAYQHAADLGWGVKDLTAVRTMLTQI